MLPHFGDVPGRASRGLRTSRLPQRYTAVGALGAGEMAEVYNGQGHYAEAEKLAQQTVTGDCGGWRAEVMNRQRATR
ncbi:MAG: hypothetical protein ACLPJH_00245 [Myxococcaceae bacterium]